MKSIIFPFFSPQNTPTPTHFPSPHQPFLLPLIYLCLSPPFPSTFYSSTTSLYFISQRFPFLLPYSFTKPFPITHSTTPSPTTTPFPSTVFPPPTPLYFFFQPFSSPYPNPDPFPHPTPYHFHHIFDNPIFSPPSFSFTMPVQQPLASYLQLYPHPFTFPFPSLYLYPNAFSSPSFHHISTKHIVLPLRVIRPLPQAISLPILLVIFFLRQLRLKALSLLTIFSSQLLSPTTHFPPSHSLLLLLLLHFPSSCPSPIALSLSP